jgi:hypothetical protein
VVLPGITGEKFVLKRKIRNRVSCSLFAERQNTDKPVNSMQNQALIQVRTEIRHFSIICLLNIVFAAMVIACGVIYMIAVVLGLPTGLNTPLFRILIGAVAMVFFGLGIQWLLATIRIFNGVKSVQDKLDAEGTAIPDDRITCLIVQMLAHYRDNRTIIEKMIRVCTFGGVCFFGIGIGTSLEFLSISSGNISFTLNNLLVIPAMLFTLGIAFASLLSSAYFSKFSKTWDRRLHEIDESECTLKTTLGLDEQ